MNVAVINLKNISKNFVKVTIWLLSLIFMIKVLISNIVPLQNFFTFEKTIQIYTSIFSIKQDYKINYEDTLKLFCPVIMIASNNKVENLENIPTLNNEIDSSEETNNVKISKNVKMEAVSEKNISENYNITYGNVKIRNQSDYTLTDEILNPQNLQLTNPKKILIYHTHTCESYTPSEKYNYTMTGNYRTTDNNFNVVRLGEELSKYLKGKNFEVIHNTAYHDYPSYTGSYERSLETVENIMKENSDIQIVIDLHRDAVGDGASYGPTVKINGESVAQMMFVIGTDGGGLEHPNWNQNLKVAIKLQETANSIYPGLFRPIIVRNSRYNQNVAPGAFIIEVGATGNTLEECLLSMQCLANILEEGF